VDRPGGRTGVAASSKTASARSSLDGDSCWQDESARRFSPRWAHAQTQSDCKANCAEAYRCGLTHPACAPEHSQLKETQ
jgi:hypothetical protein